MHNKQSRGEKMYTAGSLAEAIGGMIVGNKDREINSICSPDLLNPGAVLLVRNKKVYDNLDKTVKPLCLIVDIEPDFEAGEDPEFDYIVVDPLKMDEAFITVLSLFEKKETPSGRISDNASIDPGASIGENVTVGDFVFIGNNTEVKDGAYIGHNTVISRDCEIGKGCMIYPNVTIYPATVIKDNVIVHSGVVIGSDGFSYSKINGINRKVPQVGGVYIEKDVEIGSNTTIDRATIGCTRIGENVKIDNLVQIAHNVEIGKNSIICAMCGVSGSVRIGENVILAGDVGLADHIVIEDDVYIGPKAGVMKKVVKKGDYYMGYPAKDYKTWKEYSATFPKLKGMYKDVRRIKSKLGL
ncbi:MAG TPA: UDP-3-O-(3-hydroxymyristoyl)glucosamine N-acyltransferase [Spirochaetes bacterium]|nr:UDP-3-O-(3-hydroxymyristoyl)glucosamine N-acyltransferase [Spirochaetota bacterium]